MHILQVQDVQYGKNGSEPTHNTLWAAINGYSACKAYQVSCRRQQPPAPAAQQYVLCAPAKRQRVWICSELLPSRRKFFLGFLRAPPWPAPRPPRVTVLALYEQIPHTSTQALPHSPQRSLELSANALTCADTASILVFRRQTLDKSLSQSLVLGCQQWNSTQNVLKFVVTIDKITLGTVIPRVATGETLDCSRLCNTLVGDEHETIVNKWEHCLYSVTSASKVPSKVRNSGHLKLGNSMQTLFSSTLHNVQAARWTQYEPPSFVFVSIN